MINPDRRRRIQMLAKIIPICVSLIVSLVRRAFCALVVPPAKHALWYGDVEIREDPQDSS